MERSRPLVIAHRGGAGPIAEHTLPAYRDALSLGVDGVECDVRLTSDHHLVCVHDRRANRTSDGRGVISTLELAHLEGFDWASWHRPEGETGRGDRDTTDTTDTTDDTSNPHVPDAPEPESSHDADEPELDPERGRILTLRRLLDTLVDDGRGPLTLIETKHPSRYGGQVERRLVEVLRDYGLTTGDLHRMPAVRMMSFSRVALLRMRQLAPRVPLVLLVEEGFSLGVRGGSLPKGVNAIGLDIGIVRTAPDIVTAHLERGHEVHVWTVNDISDAEICTRLGVTSIITDLPGRMIDHLENFT